MTSDNLCCVCIFIIKQTIVQISILKIAVLISERADLPWSYPHKVGRSDSFEFPGTYVFIFFFRDW